MKSSFLILPILLFTCIALYSQNKLPVDPAAQSREIGTVSASKIEKGPQSFNRDSLIKAKLIRLALNGPDVEIANANIRIAKAELSFANGSWLGSLNASANINEFVINNSPASSFYPKYNLGLSLPFDIITRVRKDKKVSRENIIISNELKKNKEELVKAQVLIAYENYKEKNEIVFLQKSYIEYQFSAYEAAQKAYTDGDMTLDNMNKTHQLYLAERTKQVTKERDLNVAVIELEQLVGVPLSEALKLE